MMKDFTQSEIYLNIVNRVMKSAVDDKTLNLDVTTIQTLRSIWTDKLRRNFEATEEAKQRMITDPGMNPDIVTNSNNNLKKSVNSTKKDDWSEKEDMKMVYSYHNGSEEKKLSAPANHAMLTMHSILKKSPNVFGLKYLQPKNENNLNQYNQGNSDSKFSHNISSNNSNSFNSVNSNPVQIQNKPGQISHDYSNIPNAPITPQMLSEFKNRQKMNKDSSMRRQLDGNNDDSSFESDDSDVSKDDTSSSSDVEPDSHSNQSSDDVSSPIKSDSYDQNKATTASEKNPESKLKKDNEYVDVNNFINPADKMGGLDLLQLNLDKVEIPKQIIEDDPLNSDDDVVESDNVSFQDTENIIVCQFEKIIRSKTKWKFELKAGICNINDVESVFGRALGEGSW